MLTAICKVTLRLTPTVMTLVDAQVPVAQRDELVGTGSARRLRVPSDRVPAKERVDVLLIGHRHAAGEAGSSRRCRLVFGAIDKAIEMHGDGGSQEIVGFGPIAAQEPARAGLLEGCRWQYEQAQTQERWAEPLGPAFSYAFFNAAPADQQLEHIVGDERVVLEGLVADCAKLDTRLSAPALQARVRRGDGSDETLSMRCDTVLLFSDHRLCTLTFKRDIPLSSADEALSVTVVAANDDAGARAAPKPTMVLPIDEDVKVLLAGMPQAAHGDIAATADVISHTPRAAMPFPAARAAPDRGRQPRSGLPFAVARPPAPAPAPAPAAGHAVGAPLSPPPVPSPPPAPSPPSPWMGTHGALGEGQRGGNSRAAEVRPPDPLRDDPPAHTPPTHTPAPADGESDDTAKDSAAEMEPSVTCELIWFDEELPPRARRRKGWAEIAETIHHRDDELDDMVAADPADIEERQEIFEIVIRGKRDDPAELRAVSRGAKHDRGRFVPPLVLLEGTLRFCFDELDVLEATTTAASPFSGADKELKSVVEEAGRFPRLGTTAGRPGRGEHVDGAHREGGWRRRARACPTTTSSSRQRVPC